MPSGRDTDPPRRRRRPRRDETPTEAAAPATATRHAAHGVARLTDAWRALSGEYRLAAVAAVGLFLSMLLPWYDQTTSVVVRGSLQSDSSSLSAFEAFSWIEAAVLVVSVSVLVLCFTRGERRSYHLPGGDGGVVAAGGTWVALLIFIRFIDKPDVHATAVGVSWGIFVALLFGLLLAYAGLRIRAAHRPEPGPLDEAIATGHAPAPAGPGATRVMLPDEEPTRPVRPRAAPPSAPAAATPAARRRAPAPAPDAGAGPVSPPAREDPGEQLTFDA